VDTFLEKGFTYFDTAYVYHGYRSEDAVRESLVKRHHRDEFELAGLNETLFHIEIVGNTFGRPVK